ncbi:hypothetical protein ACQEU6_26480 [Spirillospora sp. CA-108201]
MNATKAATLGAVRVGYARCSTDEQPLALPAGLPADLAAAGPCLIVPDPDGRGPGLLPAALLRDRTVALGPAVPVARAADSLRWARETLALATRGVIPDGGPIRSAEHVPVLVVARAGELIDCADGQRRPRPGGRPLSRALSLR